ncbi:TadE-like protein [Diaminobutyricimonas aerilata]|uniref:TadE-like protein n=1 Tax=Diaminobutyricimonas aerilata TaxID=1162967 RepID=A0A2M9CHL0_9MICO|nr:TadE/TadG family type IV pilus assembly protein [Diaminobutyricimonas aerilata]PJJ71403.1 TadE-like protein [Diaminobutyricimonas aerilata]
MHRMLADDRGSAPAEFVLVGALLTVLTLSVIQLALALHVRNTVIDAAAEGARFAALADNRLDDGVERTRELITTALGESYARDIRAAEGEALGAPATVVTVRTPLPLLGLLGPDRALEVSGHAAREALD